MAPLFGNVRAIVFDLDDTLCGYWDAAKAGLRSAFTAHGVPGHSHDSHIATWAKVFEDINRSLNDPEVYATYCRTGQPTRERQMHETLRALGVDDLNHARRLADTYRAERNAALQLFPEALEVLDALLPLYPLAMLTNGPADIQREEIKQVGVGHYFTFIGIQGELRIGKPARAAYARVEAALELSPPDILMVGNSYSADIKPAIEYGYRTAWVRRPSDVPPSAAVDARPFSQPADSPIPDVEISDLRELLPLLGIG